MIDFDTLKKKTLNMQRLILLRGEFVIISDSEDVMSDIRKNGYDDYCSYQELYFDMDKFHIEVIQKDSPVCKAVYKMSYTQDYIDNGLAGMAGNQY